MTFRLIIFGIRFSLGTILSGFSNGGGGGVYFVGTNGTCKALLLCAGLSNSVFFNDFECSISFSFNCFFIYFFLCPDDFCFSFHFYILSIDFFFNNKKSNYYYYLKVNFYYVF